MSYQGHTESSDKSKKKGPKLVVQVIPRQGLSPHHVSVNAKLEGVSENDPEWYCKKLEWDFGDGSLSAEEPHCDPYTPETKILTEFYAEHTYEDAGKYVVRFKLGDKLRSNQVGVNVLEGRLEEQYGAKLTQ